MARKGVLMSNPDVQNMSLGQWVFEYQALVKKETDLFEGTLKAAKAVLVSVLGLNALRPVDEQGNPKEFEAMTAEEREAFLPFVAWVGRPELLKAVKEQIDKTIDPTSITADKHYEEMVAKIDAAGGDMDPIVQDTFGSVVGPEEIQNKIIQEQRKRLGIKDISEMPIDIGKI